MRGWGESTKWLPKISKSATSAIADKDYDTI